MSVEITIDEEGCQEAGQTEEVLSKAESMAKEIAAQAQLIASGHRVTGRYAAGIIVEQSKRRFKDGSQSAAFTVRATDQKSSWLEFGNGRNIKPLFILRRAVDACGFTFTKKGK